MAVVFAFAGHRGQQDGRQCFNHGSKTVLGECRLAPDDFPVGNPVLEIYGGVPHAILNGPLSEWQGGSFWRTVRYGQRARALVSSYRIQFNGGIEIKEQIPPNDSKEPRSVEMETLSPRPRIRRILSTSSGPALASKNSASRKAVLPPPLRPTMTLPANLEMHFPEALEVWTLRSESWDVGRAGCAITVPGLRKRTASPVSQRMLQGKNCLAGRTFLNPRQLLPYSFVGVAVVDVSRFACSRGRGSQARTAVPTRSRCAAP